MHRRFIPTASGGQPDRSQLAELDSLGLSERQVERLLWGLVALGIGLRILVYLLRFPIWTDEAKLAASLLDRDFAGLLEPLAYKQIAPFFFMWVQKAATVVFGFSEYSLRLVPVLSGCASVLLMRHVARRLFLGAPAVFSLALFAVSYYPIRLGAELKPYATDLLASLVLTALAVEWLREPTRLRWLWLLACAAPVTVMVSYTAALVATGVFAALAIPIWRQRDRPVTLAWVAAVLAAGGAFALNFYLAAASVYELRAAAKMPMVGGFPPPYDLLGTLGWFAQAHTGRTFGYPLGGDGGLSLLTFAAFVAGATALFRAGKRRLLAVLLLPFAAGLFAAVLQWYPYGGSGRVSQYLVPGICLLAGLGMAQLSSLARQAVTRGRAQKGVLISLLLFGALIATAAIARPYRDHCDMLGRDFARWFWPEKSRDAELVCAWEDLQLEFARPPTKWVPGGAGYRVNQQIYYQRIRRGIAPDLASVSRGHPLRVTFLGSAVSKRRDVLEEWSRDMQTRYDLVDRVQYTFDGFIEQHGRGDWLELYTFVPRAETEKLGLDALGPSGDWARSLELPVGSVERAACRSIAGWALDPDTDLPTLVEIYKPGVPQPIAAVWADLFREDLSSSGKRHGFDLGTPDALKTGQAEAFEVLAFDLGLNGNLVAPRQPLSQSQQTLTCGSGQETTTPGKLDARSRSLAGPDRQD